MEPAGKDTADEKLEMVQTSKQIEMDENKEIVNGEEKKSENEKPSLVTNEETRKDADAEEEDRMAETPPAGKEAERHSNEGVVDGEKQEETKSEWKK